MQQDTEDVVVNGSRYQISRMNAAVGSWLLFKLIDSLRKMFSDASPDEMPVEPVQTNDAQKGQAAHALVQAMLMTLDRGLFEQVQREALKVVGEYAAVGEQEVVLPVLAPNGMIGPKLRNDIASVVTLTSHALYFNLSPFFLTGGLNTVLQVTEPVLN